MKEVTFIIQCSTVNGELEMFQWLPGKINRVRRDADPIVDLIAEGLRDECQKMSKGQQIVIDIQLK